MSYTNFPPNLSISPSDYPPSSPSLLTTKLKNPSDFNAAFNSSAQLNSIRKYGIAGRVWEASYPLLQYVSQDNHWEFNPPFVNKGAQTRLNILELGAGTGIVTSKIRDIVANRDRDIIICTDLPEVCPLLEENLRELISDDGVVRVRPLTWGNENHIIGIGTELGLSMSDFDPIRDPRHLTHIVCSDLVYFPELFAPLLRTLIKLSSPPFIPSVSPDDVVADGGVTIIISYTIRSLSKETPFWSAFGLWFAFEPIMARPSSPNTHDDKLQLHWQRFGTSTDGRAFAFVARRRPESLTWKVPDNDEDLMGGVGAYNTKSRKEDDTFETLLLMALDDEEEEQ